jgi:hypothetical protein
MKLMINVISIALCAASALAQSTSPGTSQPKPIPPMANTLAAPNVTPVLSQIDTTVQNAMIDLGKLRINKWKADAQQKQQAQSDAASVERNIRYALPGMMSQVRSDPQNVVALFRLYRNVNALYDVFSALAESAGAFGPKDEFRPLATDGTNLDAARRRLGDDMESLASFAQGQLNDFRATQQQAQAAPAPPKKIIVDDETPKTKTHKKKASGAAPASTAQPAPTQQ